MDPQAPVTQDELLSATTPEALAALMGRGDDVAIQGVTAPAPAPGATEAVDAAPVAPTPAPAAAGAAPGTDSSEPSGVATKSGKGVLPYRVLADERQEKQHWRNHAQTLEQRLAETQAQLQALQQTGGTAQQQAAALAELTDEEIAQAEQDFPLLGKVARRLQAQASAPAQAPAPAAPAGDPQDRADDAAAAVHAAIGSAPLLQRWQERGGALWARAVEVDDALRGDPAWHTKPMAERFQEVQRRMADELGIEVPASQGNAPAPAPATQAPAPAPAAQVQPFRPNTLSDLGGATPQGEGGISERADGMAMVRQMSTMSDAQIMAAVRRSVG